MTIAFVKKSAQTFGDSVTSASFSLASVTAGNLVVLTMECASGVATSPAAAIPTPSGWSVGVANVGATGAAIYRPTNAIFYKLSSAGGTETASFPSLPTDSYVEGTISEYSCSGTWGFDVSGSNVISTSVSTGGTGSVSNTVATALAVVIGGADSANVTALTSPPATSYTSTDAATDNNTHCAYSAGYKILSATASQSASWSWSTSTTPFMGSIAIFKEVASGGVSLTPGAGSVALSGPAVTLARTANISLSPGQVVLTLTGPAPTLAQTSGLTLTPGNVALTISGPAPTLTQTANQSLTPGAATITLTGPAPTLTQVSGLNLIPAAKAVTLSTFAPTLAQTANVALIPAPGVLALAGPAPSFVQTGSNPYPLGSGGGPLQYFPSQASIYAEALRKRNLKWIKEEQDKTRRLEKKKRKKATPAPPVSTDPPKVEWVKAPVVEKPKPHPIEEEIRAAVKAEQDRIRKKRKQEEAVMRALTILWK